MDINAIFPQEPDIGFRGSNEPNKRKKVSNKSVRWQVSEGYIPTRGYENKFSRFAGPNYLNSSCCAIVVSRSGASDAVIGTRKDFCFWTNGVHYIFFFQVNSLEYVLEDYGQSGVTKSHRLVAKLLIRY